ncbi:MAG TPA: amidase, partial [Syntrophomonadaceae bacterium]|nr:amidase [Syntrophomonadaceae bacterium]
MTIRHNLLDMDATELAEKIASRDISSLEATNTYIEHLEKINPDINCLVENRYFKAKYEAKETDEKLEKGESGGKLFGVPISMKESFDVAGMKTTGGLPYRKYMVEEQDAEIVGRLKEEGAIILGKTNTPVLCYCQETDNKLFGLSKNPWDITRTTGGSSGGEAALIAAGGAAVGIGADVGGSIRFPSHFNGVVGFKSGDNQVSQTGSFPPMGHPLQKQMFGIGAIAKSVRDARMINEILAYE